MTTFRTRSKVTGDLDQVSHNAFLWTVSLFIILRQCLRPGRRVCPGWKVGEMNVWITVARLIYCFDFTEIEGKPIDTMTIPQITKNAAPFDVKVTSRSEGHAALIRRECEEAVKTRY